MSKQDSRFPEKKPISYDAIFKRFIEHLSDENIIAFINGTFGKSYPKGTPIERLNTESNTEKRRIADIYLWVGDSMFHMKLQSDDDNSMALRMFEYGFRGALLHGRLPGDEITVRFPEPVVIYLRSKDKTARELAINVEFPHIGQTVRYTVPVKRLSDLTPEIILEQNLIPLLPFYPMKYEGVAVPSAQAFRELKEICEGIVALRVSGRLSETEAADLLMILCDICERTAERTSNGTLKEAAKIMSAMETILTYDVWDLTEKAEAAGIAEGIAKGIAKGKAEGITEGKAEMQQRALEFMFRAGIDDKTVMLFAQENGISPEQFEQLRKEAEKESEAASLLDSDDETPET